MRHLLGRNITAFAALISSLTMIPLFAATRTDLIEGTAAFGDWRADRSGPRPLIRPQDLTTQDLPAPDRAASANNSLRIVRRTDDQKPIVPNGFEVNRFASGQAPPGLIRVAPTMMMIMSLVAENDTGPIGVLRPNGKESRLSAGLRRAV
jgi:hypothetical protein